MEEEPETRLEIALDTIQTYMRLLDEKINDTRYFYRLEQNCENYDHLKNSVEILKNMWEEED